jgi:hypothetical protein
VLGYLSWQPQLPMDKPRLVSGLNSPGSLHAHNTVSCSKILSFWSAAVFLVNRDPHRYFGHTYNALPTNALLYNTYVWEDEIIEAVECGVDLFSTKYLCSLSSSFSFTSRSPKWMYLFDTTCYPHLLTEWSYALCIPLEIRPPCKSSTNAPASCTPPSVLPLETHTPTLSLALCD